MSETKLGEPIPKGIPHLPPASDFDPEQIIEAAAQPVDDTALMPDLFEQSMLLPLKMTLAIGLTSMAVMAGPVLVPTSR